MLLQHENSLKTLLSEEQVKGLTTELDTMEQCLKLNQLLDSHVL